MRKLSKLPLSHPFRLMPVGVAFAFSLAAVTASHAQSVSEDWESVDVDVDEEVDGWSSEWTFYHDSPTIRPDIETYNRTGHPEGFTKLGFVSASGLGQTTQTWATLGDTLFTDTVMSSDVGSTVRADMRVGVFTRFTADVNDNLSYYMARWAENRLELIRKTTLGSETLLAGVDVLGSDMEGTFPRSSLSFSVMNIGGQAQLEATFTGAPSGGSNVYTISAVDENPLGVGLVGVYGQTGDGSSRNLSFDNFQAAIPEPAAIGLMFGGLALVMTLRRRRNLA